MYQSRVVTYRRWTVPSSEFWHGTYDMYNTSADPPRGYRRVDYFHGRVFHADNQGLGVVGQILGAWYRSLTARRAEKGHGWIISTLDWMHRTTIVNVSMRVSQLEHGSSDHGCRWILERPSDIFRTYSVFLLVLQYQQNLNHRFTGLPHRTFSQV